MYDFENRVKQEYGAVRAWIALNPAKAQIAAFVVGIIVGVVVAHL